MRFLLDTAGWADAVAAMPADGPLPSRTVLVPNEWTAHALRRELLSSGRGTVLSGTRLVSFTSAALEVLHGADIPARVDPPGRRARRIAKLVEAGGLGLASFPDRLLSQTSGWADAFHRSIGDLEAAGLRPSELRASISDPQIADVCTLWEKVEATAPFAWSSARIVCEATRALASGAAVWPFDGGTSATLLPSFSAVHALFARAIPSASITLFVAKPLRETYLARVRALLGDEAESALRTLATPAATPTSERDVLARYLFETPEVLADPTRPRSGGMDGTVHLEEHAGAEAEIEAAADWVARQVVEHRRPLDRIAVLMPHASPLAPMIADRIGRLGTTDGSPRVAVMVAGGRPFASVAAGARTLAVLRALRCHLPAHALVEILPFLRPREGDRLGAASAASLVFSLGTAGGSDAAPDRALDWRPHLERRGLALRAAPEGREGEDAARLLGDLERIQGAVGRLSAIAQCVLDGEPLSALAAGLGAFIQSDVLLPPIAVAPTSAGAEPTYGAPAASLITATLGEMVVDPVLSTLRGTDALEAIESELLGLSLAGYRYGEPAVFVGAIKSAIGLPLDAVRIVGLSEGHWPSIAREDAVLPDDLRRRVAPDVLSLTSDRPLGQLHALASIVQHTRSEVILSMSRFDADRSQREPSAVLLEAAAALGRPSQDSSPTPLIPDLRVLQRDAFRPAREQLASSRRHRPLSAAAVLTRAASRSGPIPRAWFGSPALDVERIRAMLDAGPIGASEGILDPSLDLVLPGLTADNPTSASTMGRLLECPHRFLFERVLRWREPPETSSPRHIDPLTYGKLFHKVSEDFFRLHGASFSARAGSVLEWKATARPILEAALMACVESYPPLSPSIRAAERARLEADVDRFLDAEWGATTPPRFVAAERAFGQDGATTIEVNQSKLHLRGFIDRIDVEGDRVLVRDLKTGRAHPRRGKEKGPVAGVDFQIGVYAEIVKQQPEAQGKQVVAAYVYTSDDADRERSFRDDADALSTATHHWVGIAHGLLTRRAFPRTPSPSDCTFCRFKPVCGDDFHARVATALEESGDGPLRAFGRLKSEEDE